MDSMEAGMIMDARLSQLTAWAALHSHQDADIEKAGAQISLKYIDALSTIPYLTNGMSGTDRAHKEREDAVARYRAYRDRVLQGNTLRAPKPRNSGIIHIGGNKDAGKQ